MSSGFVVVGDRAVGRGMVDKDCFGDGILRVVLRAVEPSFEEQVV